VPKKAEVTDTLGKFTYGIYVLTTSHEGTINGMIASWVTQVSYEPFLVMVAVHPNRYTHTLMRRSGHFALNILARDQKDLIHPFKGLEPEGKFKDIQWEEGATGAPVLKECIGYLECRIFDTHKPGNHTLFIGEVLHTNCSCPDKIPLTTRDYGSTYLGKR
jgi:flavin reductase (DIM6/NTAB) family NADH-FMN oxidoreductase RutF